jgi:hypothetical protein
MLFFEFLWHPQGIHYPLKKLCRYNRCNRMLRKGIFCAVASNVDVLK